MGLLDCKKSNWQFLHGLKEEQQFSLLQELSSTAIAFAEASVKAKALKKEEALNYECFIIDT